MPRRKENLNVQLTEHFNLRELVASDGKDSRTVKTAGNPSRVRAHVRAKLFILFYCLTVHSNKPKNSEP